MENYTHITTQHLVKQFPIGGRKFTALNDINLTFKTGEFSGLVGPSGSGKTTLLNIIGALDNPTEGSAVVIGHGSIIIGIVVINQRHLFNRKLYFKQLFKNFHDFLCQIFVINQFPYLNLSLHIPMGHLNVGELI